MKPVYMDHAATTPVRPEVVEAMLPFLADTFGNPSSIHLFGQKARKALDDARETVAERLAADRDEIYFTSGGTESDNLAIRGTMPANGSKAAHIVTSAIEHHAVLNCCAALESHGHSVTYLPVDRAGIVDIDALKESMRPDTAVVSVMLGNNEVGTVQPIAEIARIAGERGIPLHTDAVQAVGKIPVDVRELGIDLLSVSGHKFHGPKGIGVLYVRKGTRVAPLMHGGHHERRLRPGTENVPAIVGFAKALELAIEEMPAAMPRVAALRDRLEREIQETIPHVHINGHPAKRLPHILNVSFEFVEGESVLLGLDMQGVAVSTGSACTSGSVDPSHVLAAMGIAPAIARGSVRFSLGRDNTEAEIDFVLKSLNETVARFRDMSPMHDGGATR